MDIIDKVRKDFTLDAPNGYKLHKVKFRNWGNTLSGQALLIEPIDEKTEISTQNLAEIANWAAKNKLYIRPYRPRFHCTMQQIVPKNSTFENNKCILLSQKFLRQEPLIELLNDNTEVRVKTGVLLCELITELNKVGMTLNSIPRIGEITIGGAIANSAAGRNLQSVPFSSIVKSFTAIVWDAEKNSYVLKSFEKQEASSANYLLLSSGRSLLVEVVLYTLKEKTCEEHLAFFSHEIVLGHNHTHPNAMVQLLKNTQMCEVKQNVDLFGVTKDFSVSVRRVLESSYGHDKDDNKYKNKTIKKFSKIYGLSTFGGMVEYFAPNVLFILSLIGFVTIAKSWIKKLQKFVLVGPSAILELRSKLPSVIPDKWYSLEFFFFIDGDDKHVQKFISDRAKELESILTKLCDSKIKKLQAQSFDIRWLLFNEGHKKDLAHKGLLDTSNPDNLNKKVLVLYLGSMVGLPVFSDLMFSFFQALEKIWLSDNFSNEVWVHPGLGFGYTSQGAGRNFEICDKVATRQFGKDREKAKKALDMFDPYRVFSNDWLDKIWGPVGNGK